MKYVALANPNRQLPPQIPAFPSCTGILRVIQEMSERTAARQGFFFFFRFRFKKITLFQNEAILTESQCSLLPAVPTQGAKRCASPRRAREGVGGAGGELSCSPRVGAAGSAGDGVARAGRRRGPGTGPGHLTHSPPAASPRPRLSANCSHSAAASARRRAARRAPLLFGCFP